MRYEEFVAEKLRERPLTTPVERRSELNEKLFPFQRDIVDWALSRGRAAIFADCGLGKGPIGLEWARHVHEYTRRRVLILAPLAVSQQTIREGEKFGIHCEYAADGDAAQKATSPIVVTNYERADRFDPAAFSGVVLDESSVIKAYTGKRKRLLMQMFTDTPHRLCCTATPAPNDHLELGNHSEFLGQLTSHEMIARWFINDHKEFGTYRLKHHAVDAFWRWVCSWARCLGVPSDIGDYDDSGYILPELRETPLTVEVDPTIERGEQLFRIPDMSATQVHKERRITAPRRAAAVAELVRAEPEEPWIVWCETNYDADAVAAELPEAVDVRGSMSLDKKEARIDAFTRGDTRVLICKPNVAGFGLNWQHCARVAFAGPTWSFEAYYQAVRRTWRFGQSRPVDVYTAMAETETEIWRVLTRKARQHEELKHQMFAAARAEQREESSWQNYKPRKLAPLPTWLRSA